jgi:hypothetical protein
MGGAMLAREYRNPGFAFSGNSHDDRVDGLLTTSLEAKTSCPTRNPLSDGHDISDTRNNLVHCRVARPHTRRRLREDNRRNDHVALLGKCSRKYRSSSGFASGECAQAAAVEYEE